MADDTPPEILINKVWKPFLQDSSPLEITNDGQLNWNSVGNYEPRKNIFFPSLTKKDKIIKKHDAWTMYVLIKNFDKHNKFQRLTLKVWVKAKIDDPAQELSNWSFYPFFPVNHVAYWLENNPDEKLYFDPQYVPSEEGLAFNLGNFSSDEDKKQKFDEFNKMLFSTNAKLSKAPAPTSNKSNISYCPSPGLRFNNQDVILEILKKYPNLATYVYLLNRPSRVAMTIFNDFEDQYQFLNSLDEQLESLKSDCHNEVRDAKLRICAYQNFKNKLGNTTKKPDLHKEKFDPKIIALLREKETRKEMLKFLRDYKVKGINPKIAATYVYYITRELGQQTQWGTILKQSGRILNKDTRKK